MYQVSPEDQLQVVKRQQTEWRAESENEHVARAATVGPDDRTPPPSRAGASHRFLAHATHFLHVLMAGHGTGRARPAH